MNGDIWFMILLFFDCWAAWFSYKWCFSSFNSFYFVSVLSAESVINTKFCVYSFFVGVSVCPIFVSILSFNSFFGSELLEWKLV